MSSKMYVSSVTYPLGDDDPANRVDYIKHTVLNAILQERGIAGSITNSLLHGQGMKLRHAYRYARDHYHFGLPYSGALYTVSPDKDLLRGILSARNMDREIILNHVAVTLADFAYWAERWLAINYGYDRLAKRFMRPPPGVSADAAVTYDLDPNGTINIMVMNPGGASQVLRYKPKDFDSQKFYVHTVYQTVTNFLPVTSTTTREATPGEIDSVSNIVTIVDREKDIQETIEVTHTVIDNLVVPAMATTTYRKTVRVLARPQYFLYRIGAGTYPAIDGWLTADSGPEATSPYFPSIPLRINNANMATTVGGDAAWEHHDLRKTATELLKKVGVNYDDMMDRLEDNPQLGEIDFAFLQFGIAANTRTPECKKYIYRFLEYLRGLSAVSRAQFDAWVDLHTQTVANMAANGLSGDGSGDTGGGGVVPPTGTGDKPTTGYSTPPCSVLRIYDEKTRGYSLNLDIELQWRWIETTQHSGTIQGHTNPKPGTCEVFTRGGEVSLLLAEDMIVDGSSLVAQRQIDVDTYEEIEICGFVHLNYVYEGKFVFVTAYDAFNEPDEEGFIIPLNEQMLREMSLKDVTQLSYDCMHIVLNCYKVVKKKWYQSDWFAVLLIIVAIVLLVITWGGSSGLSASMASTAIGTAVTTVAVALGVSVFVAMIIVATVTVLVSMYLMKILSPVFVDVFGPTWGPIILAIAMMLTMNWASTGSMLGSGTTALTQINASTLIQGSIAALNTYGAVMQAKLGQLDVPGQMEKMKTEYESRMEEIEKLTKENLGTSTDIIDIEGFIKATEVKFEGPESFFRRTMLTGSDICMITQGLIENFVDVGLQLPTNA